MRLIAILMSMAVAMGTGLSTAACSAEQPPEPKTISREAFQGAFLERMRARVGAENVTVGADSIEVAVPGGATYTVYLDGAYRRYQSGEELDHVLNTMVSLVGRTEATGFDEQAAYILIRPAEMFADSADAETINKPIERSFAGSVSMVLAVDQVDAFSYPPRADVVEVNPDVDQVWNAAIARTVGALGPLQVETMEGGALLVLAERDDIGGSVILSQALWSRPDVARLGERIAVAVFRDAAVLADADDANGVSTLRRLLARMSEDPNFVSDRILLKTNDRWSVLTP